MVFFRSPGSVDQMFLIARYRLSFRGSFWPWIRFGVWIFCYFFLVFLFPSCLPALPLRTARGDLGNTARSHGGAGQRFCFFFVFLLHLVESPPPLGIGGRFLILGLTVRFSCCTFPAMLFSPPPPPPLLPGNTAVSWVSRLSPRCVFVPPPPPPVILLTM